LIHLKFAIAKQSITPDTPVFLAGFGTRDRKSEGVLDEIFVKVAWLESMDPLVVITLDALGGDRSFVIGIKEALREINGLKTEQVLINFSHTHCSVFLTGEAQEGRRGGYSLGQEQWPEKDEDIDYTEDIRYYRFIRDTIVGLVQQCSENLTEGTLDLLKGISNAGISRRLLTEEGLMFKPNFQAETDQDLFVLQLLDSQGELKGLLFSYGCHPTCMGPNKISAEFVGQACTELEASFPDSIAIFLQGCGADIKPLKTVIGDRFKSCSIEEMREAGVELAEDVKRTMSECEALQLSGSIRTAEVEVRLFTEPWGLTEMLAIVEDGTKTDYRRRAARRTVDAIYEGSVRQVLPFTITVWGLGDGFRMIALEGEVPSDYAIQIKKMFSTMNVMVLGYSNGVSTYIPTRRILKEGGYEAEAFVLHGFRGPFVPENEWILLGAVKEAEERLHTPKTKKL
jgi:neutral ceramidase